MRIVGMETEYGILDPVRPLANPILMSSRLVEGARVEILHTGPIGGDPLAVRVDDARVAIRRREADMVLIRADGETR